MSSRLTKTEQRQLIAIGKRIKQAREEAGMRQIDLADLIHVSDRAVLDYESGKTRQFRKLHEITSAIGSRPYEWYVSGKEGTVSSDDLLPVLEQILVEVKKIAKSKATGAPVKAPRKRA